MGTTHNQTKKTFFDLLIRPLPLIHAKIVAPINFFFIVGIVPDDLARFLIDTSRLDTSSSYDLGNGSFGYVKTVNYDGRRIAVKQMNKANNKIVLKGFLKETRFLAQVFSSFIVQK